MQSMIKSIDDQLLVDTTNYPQVAIDTPCAAITRSTLS